MKYNFRFIVFCFFASLIFVPTGAVRLLQGGAGACGFLLPLFFVTQALQPVLYNFTLSHSPNEPCCIISPLRGLLFEFCKDSDFYSSLSFLPLCCKRKNSFCCSISLRSSSSVGMYVMYFAWNSLSLSFRAVRDNVSKLDLALASAKSLYP